MPIEQALRSQPAPSQIPQPILVPLHPACYRIHLVVPAPNRHGTYPSHHINRFSYPENGNPREKNFGTDAGAPFVQAAGGSSSPFAIPINRGVTRWENGARDESVTLQYVLELGVRSLSLDELSECYVRHEALVAEHARVLDADEDLKKLDCDRCGLTNRELAVLLADSTRGPSGLVLTQTGIDVVQGAVERMQLHHAVLRCQLDLNEVCRITRTDRVKLETRIPAWRSLLALGA